MTTIERPDSRVDQCFKCHSTLVVAVTYASFGGHPVQRGVCSDHTTGLAHVDRLSTEMQSKEG